MTPAVGGVRRLAAALLLLAAHPVAPAAQGAAPAAPPPPADVRVIPLWEERAPGALGDEPADRPALTHYPARGGSGTAVIVAPGGGYGTLAMNHEGRQVANWLNAQGITAFVLRYRLGPRYRHPVQMGDAQRAIRLVRSRAAEFRVSPDRVGMLGFSAGGHLASTVGTHFDAGRAAAADPVERAGSRPDFLVLAYPVTALEQPYNAQTGSRRVLLGEGADPEHVRFLSTDRHVTARTPPTFLFHTTDDNGVAVMNSVAFYSALVEAGVPAEMHLFASGPHGVGLALDDPALSHWPELLSEWLRARGLLRPPPPAPLP